MHIVILADSIDNQNAGVHVYTKNLIKNLLKTDKKNRYTFIHCKENSFFEDKEDIIIPRGGIPLSGTIRKFYKIPKVIRQLKPDVVFEPCHIGPFNIPKNVKRVVMIHDLTPILFPKFHVWRSVIMHKLMLKRVLRNADVVLTASETTRRDIMKYQPKTKDVVVIPLGVDHINVVKDENVQLGDYILYLGTIEPRKNLKLLIKAYLELKNEGKIKEKLVLAGGIGWRSSKIVELASKSDDIVVTGFLTEEEKNKYYSGARLFVYPSIYEGFGFPPLEAISYGVNVVASDGGSLREVLKDSVTYFNPQDKAGLKRAILEALSRKLPFSKEILNSYRWEETARKTLEVFEVGEDYSSSL